MGARTLKECVENGGAEGRVFESDVNVTSNFHDKYVFSSLSKDLMGLEVFPAKEVGGEVVVEKYTVGLSYWQRQDDREFLGR